MPRQLKRDDELANKADVREQLLKIFRDIEQGFTDQHERVDDTLDYWDVYNCKFGARQFYNGNSKIYVPLVRAAIEARKTRYVNQLFPQAGRYVDVVTENGDIPHATISLLEYYVRKAKFRTELVPALSVAGDVEGQYSVYVGWRRNTRHIVSRDEKPVQIAGLEIEELGTVETMVHEEVDDEGPYAEVIADTDLLVLPATADSIDEALGEGGSVTVVRRWSKAKIRQMAEEGEIDADAADNLLNSMAKKEKSGVKDTQKELASAVGIRNGGGSSFAQVYETWVKLSVKDADGKIFRLCRAYYGGDDRILGAKLNPYWCDLPPVISAPVKKIPGVFKGRSLVADVIDLQVLANDTMNEGADTAHMSAMPIIATDPVSNPRTGTMVLALGAVWEVDPTKTRFMEFPQLWKDALERIVAIKGQIFEILGVNPSMLPQQTGTKSGKRNQAEIALEQQVDLLTTADAVTNIEESILTPVLMRFAAYDHQFRDKSLLVQTFGDMGLRARMEEIEPLQMDKRYEFRWFGVEAARNAQAIQQQIGFINVVKSIPPALYPGYKLNLAPALLMAFENAFGPRLAPLTFRDMKMELSKPPELENEMLQQGFPVEVSPLDDDKKHLEVHMPLMQSDESGNVRVHIQMHMQQMQQKAQAAAMQASPQMQQAQGARGPQAGAPPGNLRPMKQPPGAIHQDRMPAAGAMAMPRKM